MTEKNSTINSNLIIVLIVIGIVAIGLLAMGLKDNNITISPEAHDSTLSVNANIELEVEPDMAVISLGVSHLMPDASEAQEAVNSSMNSIIDALGDMGVTEEDIETTQISLYEERRWYQEDYETYGWRASQTININTTDLENAGDIIDVCVANGANDINGVTFTLSKDAEREYREEALEQTGALAKEKASAIAEGLDISIGNIKSVNESSFYYSPYEYYAANEDMAKEPTPTVVIPGKVSISASIAVIYYID